jgi:sec-independent protein translocase protein TatC
MPLFDHLAEFRRRLTIVIVSVIAAALVVYLATPTLISIMFDPIYAVLPEGSQLTVLSALGGFSIRFKVSLFFGSIMCTPIILWEVLGFFLPALTPDERKWVLPTLAAMVALFFLGMIFCYLVIQKAAFGWLIEQITEFATATVNAEDYLSIMMLLEVGFGFAFQLPLIVFYLSILHVVPYRTFREGWRYVYVVLLVLCGVVTPDASPITMVLMYAVMVSLYEISLAIARHVIILRDGKEALNWTREEYEAHELEKYKHDAK